MKPLRRNKHAKMAVEATIKDDIVVVYGEQNLFANLDPKALPADFDPTIDFASIAKKVLKDIGYDAEFKVFVLVGSQSKDIFDKVVLGNETAAGDQGIMFGYACNDTPNYMPLAIDTAHKLSKRLSDFKREDSRIKPDGKTQVTVLYEADKPVRITKVVVSTQHAAELQLPQLRDLIRKEVIDKVIDPKWIDPSDFETIINPGGNFIIGGPEGDFRYDRQKDRCRYLRRDGSHRRRLFQFQGSFQSGIVLQRITAVMSPKTSSPTGLLSAVRSKSLMRSA